METKVLKDVREIRKRLSEQGHTQDFINAIVEMFEDDLIIVTYDGKYVYISLSEKGEKVASAKGLNTDTMYV